ncbi:MAG: helix-turn-helix transcriptional regulator [Gammaproteobacteria bacterium]|nr:helix-turn-helix transcriptional regulator [Gammaproteobacteria bacterium]
MTDDQKLGARIRELRLLKGWSQQELADKTGGSRPQIGRDEREGGFSTDRILRYAEAFGVGPDLILEVTDPVEEIRQGKRPGKRPSARRGRP